MPPVQAFSKQDFATSHLAYHRTFSVRTCYFSKSWRRRTAT